MLGGVSVASANNAGSLHFHFKRHLKNRETVSCPFADCLFKSRVISTFTAHRSHCHQSSTLEHFRPDLVVCERNLTLTSEEQLDSEDSSAADFIRTSVGQRVRSAVNCIPFPSDTSSCTCVSVSCPGNCRGFI